MAEFKLILDALNPARENERDGIVRSSDLSSSDRERLLQSGWLAPFERGYYTLGRATLQHNLLANPLKRARQLAHDGVLGSSDLSPADRARLLRSGWLTRIARGSYLLREENGVLVWGVPNISK